LLCLDVLSNQLSDVMAEEATLVIPHTPLDCMLQADSYHAVAPVVSMVQVVACDSTVVSSLTHLNDLMASKLKLLSHLLTNMQENEVVVIQQSNHMCAQLTLTRAR